jgi:signal transduction histidine kinase
MMRFGVFRMPRLSPSTIVLAILVGAAACAGVPASGVRWTTEAERLFASDLTPPPDGPGWETAPLPDYWRPDARRGLTAWYRTTVRLDGDADELWAVYLPRIGQTASVWVNDRLVGGGPDTDPLPRDWIRPHLFTIPEALLRPGANDVAVRIRTHIGAPGYLRTIEVGPERILQPLYESALWWGVELTQIIAAASCVAGLVILLVSLNRPELDAGRWASIGLVVWSWGSADAFVRHISVSTRLWEWSVGMAPMWAVACFAVAFHRVVRLDRPRRDATFLAAASCVSAAFLLLAQEHAFTGTLTAGAVAVAGAGYLVVLLLRTPREGDADRRRFLVPAIVGMLLGLHDIVAIVTGRRLAGLLLSPYIPAVALVTGAWVLLGRLVDTHRETIALNRDLERRVDEKHRELEANYARLARLERQHAVAEERERLMRDVHDGVGGQLVSALALVEQGDGGRDAVVESIRAALEDLRLVIDSLDPSEDDLLSVLGSVRSRLEPRLARHGLHFAWQVTDLPAIEGFGPDMALQAMRVVQEAVTNVVKHADARTVTVRTGTTDGDGPGAGVFIEVRDDGCGIAPHAPRGRGLANMRRRATRLGGRVDVQSDGVGTAVRLWLPRARR